MRPSAWAISLLGLTSAHEARAQGVAEVLPRGDERARVELGVVTTLLPQSRDVRTSHLAPTLGAGLRLVGPWMVALDATYAVTSYEITGRDGVTVGRFGNPFVDRKSVV